MKTNLKLKRKNCPMNSVNRELGENVQVQHSFPC
jgi:hypothetical protein